MYNQVNVYEQMSKELSTVIVHVQIVDTSVLARPFWFVWCTTWLVPGNPFAPLGLNSNYDIHSATRLLSN